MRDDVLVVIRSVGEKTEKICYDIACDQVGEENVFIIHEKPFWKAVKKTFELGLASDKKWTLALDADVLLKQNAVNEMIWNAKKYGSKLFIYQGYIFDYILGIYREGGPHLYQNIHLEKAQNIIDADPFIIRPETYVQKKMIAQFGAIKITDNKVFGLHDFYQYPFDYFRKSFLHGVKDKSFGGAFFSNYCKNVFLDINFKIMMEGWAIASENLNRVELNIDYFENLLKDRFYQLNIRLEDNPSLLEIKEIYRKAEEIFKEIKPKIAKRMSVNERNYLFRIRFKFSSIIESLKNV
jgi:hypothetical protein